MKWKTRLAYKILSPSTWDRIRFDWSMSHRRLQNRRGTAARLFEHKEGLRLHLGCGLRATKGWVNIDAFEHPSLDLRWDLRDALPFGAGIAELVYSEHVLEHLEYENATQVLQELFRVLAPNGRLRVGVPDAGLYLKAYAAGNQEFFKTLKNIGNPVSPLDTPIKVINQMFRMGGAHRYAWDFETLSREIARAGFINVARWPSGSSSLPSLCLDDSAHAKETLYIEAEKPGHGAATLVHETAPREACQ